MINYTVSYEWESECIYNITRLFFLYFPTVKECQNITDAKSGKYTISPLNLIPFKLRCEDWNWTVRIILFFGKNVAYIFYIFNNNNYIYVLCNKK